MAFFSPLLLIELLLQLATQHTAISMQLVNDFVLIIDESEEYFAISKSPERLFRHFLQHSLHVAASQCFYEKMGKNRKGYFSFYVKITEPISRAPSDPGDLA